MLQHFKFELCLKVQKLGNFDTPPPTRPVHFPNKSEYSRNFLLESLDTELTSQKEDSSLYWVEIIVDL